MDGEGGGDRGARYLGNSTKVSPKSSLRSTFTFLYFAKLVTAVLSTTKGFPNLEEAEQLIFPEMTFTELYCRIHGI